MAIYSNQDNVMGDLLEQLKGWPVRVTSALPFVARDENGENLGPVHWFHMSDYIWVSQEFYEKLKENVPSVGD